MIPHTMKVYLHLLCCIKIMTIIHGESIQQFDVTESVDKKRTFSVDPENRVFRKDGSPFQYFAGSMHYSRIPEIYWKDRLSKAKAVGLDAVSLYIPWNFHESEEGIFNFEGDRDLLKFLDLIQELDLLAIVRAGPYICAEWQFGGLPPWLLRKNPKMKIRTSDPSYTSAVVNWFNVLLPKLNKYLYNNNGPIIMVQLENEYGSTGICDRAYLSMLYDLARKHLGDEIVLFTTDGNAQSLLACGSNDPRYLATIDFGPSRTSANQSFDSVRKFRPNQPLVNSEYYSGWFDRWGGGHSRTDGDLFATDLYNLMTYSKEVSVNIYMFHGGTNFGFWNGAGVTTSYDYDAPLSEAGDTTLKYTKLSKIIHQFKGETPPSVPPNITRFAYGEVTMKRHSHIVNHGEKLIQTKYPINMEALKKYDGLMLYATELPIMSASAVRLSLQKFADVVHVYMADASMKNLTWCFSVESNGGPVELVAPYTKDRPVLLLLLQNTGYANFGSKLLAHELKGLLGPVSANGKRLENWYILQIPNSLPKSFNKLERDLNTLPTQGTIFMGTLKINTQSEIFDTYIHAESFSQGLMFINGFLLGTFNQLIGPQLRLYLPKQYLHPGDNFVTILELQSVSEPVQRISFHKDQLWLQ